MYKTCAFIAQFTTTNNTGFEKKILAQYLIKKVFYGNYLFTNLCQ